MCVRSQGALEETRPCHRPDEGTSKHTLTHQSAFFSTLACCFHFTFVTGFSSFLTIEVPLLLFLSLTRAFPFYRVSRTVVAERKRKEVQRGKNGEVRRSQMRLSSGAPLQHCRVDVGARATKITLGGDLPPMRPSRTALCRFSSAEGHAPVSLHLLGQGVFATFRFLRNAHSFNLSKTFPSAHHLQRQTRRTRKTQHNS